MKRGKLKGTERWRMNGQNTEVVDKFIYVGNLCWKSQGVGINRKHGLKLKDIKLLYISNPQY
jgi:hypothetical protein